MDTGNFSKPCNPCRINDKRDCTINITGLMSFALKNYQKAKNNFPSFLLRDDPKNYNIQPLT